MAASIAGQQTGVNMNLLIYGISILVLGLIALLFLCRLPRLIARLRWSEISKGHFLRNTAYIPRAPRIVHMKRANTVTRRDGTSTDDDHTYVGHHTVAKRVDEKGAEMTMNYPPHVSACPSIFRSVQSELTHRIFPGFSLGQVVSVMLYTAAWIYPTFYKSNPLIDLPRTGWVGIAQLPFIFAFAAKNNALGPFLGMGYEKFNFIHRYAGYIFVLAVNVHSMGFVYKWCFNSTFMESMAKPHNAWGFVGFIFADFVYFFSTEYFRKTLYNVFIGTHIVGWPVVLVACYMHMPVDKPFVLAALGVYALDYVLRLVKTRIHTATIRPVTQMGLTRIEIPSINSGWRAGQHVRLRVLSTKMGIAAWSEVHPFTIASASDTHDGMVLLAKKAGNWTTSLFDLAKINARGESQSSTVKVMVEGPYGGPGHLIPASFSAAVFVVGGSGISFALASIEELVQKDLRGESRVKIIELVWIVQDPAALVPFVPKLSALIQTSVFTPLRISVFYTRAVTGKFPFPKDFFQPGLTLSPGRPKISTMLESTISKTVTLGAGVKDHEANTGMLVGICGPLSLADNVAAEVGKIDPTRRDQVGGVEMIEEAFGW
ncbi:hypothetical protein CYLTODRAFT_488935 [Cylindrobasidium torrendii FP15055 ss-10]|uniref:ferric-chelate reductase (NADPH) n=1 Tax=Cylindrobasidium torrendii FP15055 ss-10 TaxID=1314674 RepID=A0A0D7BFX6_9AGAR|nr:hypothetical protein CYLTODRAFT_488935 [Cylindrobasidium torrendii FP15055 ss-10]